MHAGCHGISALEVGLRNAGNAGRGARLRGTSGWVYKGWRAHLYADTPIKQWLLVASRAFDALAIWLYALQPATYARWHAETPEDFRFALKGHRFVTHYKRLRDCASSVVLLRDQPSSLHAKLAAVVWELPVTRAHR